MRTGRTESGSGQLVRSCRTRAGMSQEELARRSGISPRTIRQIEAGRSRPRPVTLRLLATALGLSDTERREFMMTALPPDPVVAEHVASAFAPRQLPVAPVHFAGREAELAELDRSRAEEDARLWSVTGPGGIGKTWLALRWAHARRDDFADGQLYLNLRGFDVQAPAMTTREALRYLLESLGIVPGDVPAEEDTAAALYRSLLADKRVLVLLDDAADERQLEPLLPSGPGCTTIVTSRHHLIGLTTARGAGHIGLVAMPPAEAERALRMRLGATRMAAEPDATAALVRYSAGFPLAIGLLGARAAGHPEFALSMLAEELRDESTRLDAFDRETPDSGIRAVFAASRARLTAPADRLFRELGRDVVEPSTEAIARHIGEVPGRARKLLRELEDAHLLEQSGPGRYRLGELVRLFAAEQRDHEGGAPRA